MNKSKLLIISVVTLAALNIALILVLTLGHSPRPPHNMGGPKQIVIEKLHFDANQIEAYEELISVHRETIRSKEEEMRVAKESLYHSLSSNNQDKRDELIAKINIIQKNFEEIHYNHFLDIKKLCKPDQIKDYNELTNELARIFSPQKMPPKR
jgi:periplasmic protein CpxP/Spy